MTFEVLAQVQSRRFKVKTFRQRALPREAGSGAGTVTAQLHGYLCVSSFFLVAYLCYRVRPIIHNEALRVFSTQMQGHSFTEGL